MTSASCHSWVLRSCQRRLTATPSWAVACPSLVYRISGSRVRLPVMVVVLAMACSSLSHMPPRPRGDEECGGAD